MLSNPIWFLSKNILAPAVLFCCSLAVFAAQPASITTTLPTTSAPSSSTSPIVTPTGPHAANQIQKQFSFKQLTGADGLLLSGANAMRVLYLPIPQEWIIDNITLQLSLYSSSLFGVPSTLTASINNNPITSIRINSFFNVNNKWTVTIPGNLISGNLLSVTFNNMLDDFGNNCYNLTNPKFWLFITGTSTITYNYHVPNFVPDLTKFPYPFVNNPAIEKDTVIIVLPDKPNADDYTVAFYLANALVNKSTWLGVKLTATTVSQLTDAQKKNNNLIYIGKPDELHLADIQANWPLVVDTSIHDANKNVINPQTGVIMLSPSPWNPIKAILAITGNSNEGIIKAANMLRNPEFANSVLFNQYALITQDNTRMEFHPTWTDNTLEDLSFPNQIVYGGGQNIINYDIDLPQDKIIDGMTMLVNYASSPFLSTNDSSYLMLRVNDSPVDGIAIKPGSAGVKTWKVTIDGRNLRNGSNRISFIFSLYNQNQHCRPEDNSLVWGTIYNTTMLHLNLNNGNVFLNFKIFKASPYNLLISYPANNPYFQSIDFAQQVLDISQDMPLVQDVSFTDNDHFSTDNIDDNNVIYYTLSDNNNLATLFDKLPFILSDNKLKIDPILKPYVAASHEIPISMTEVIRSSANPDRMIMIVEANDDQGFKNAIALFTDAKKSALIDGNAVLLYKNGTFTSIKADKIIATENKKKRIKFDIAYVFFALVALCILLFIIRRIYKKIKTYVKPKEE